MGTVTVVKISGLKRSRNYSDEVEDLKTLDESLLEANYVTRSIFEKREMGKCIVTRGVTVKRAGEKLNLCRDFKVPGSNLARAPFVVSFLLCFQLQDCLKSYERGDENSYKKGSA